MGWLLSLTLDAAKGDLVTPHRASPWPDRLGKAKGSQRQSACKVGTGC